MSDGEAELAFLQSMKNDDTSASPVPKGTEFNQTSIQPRSIGGFIIDDEEDEEEAAMPEPLVVSSTGVLNVDRDSSNTSQQSLVKSPHAASPINAVSIQTTTHDQDLSVVVSHGATNSVPNLAAFIPINGAPEEDLTTAAPSQTLPVPDQVPSIPVATEVSTSIPKARLPHDRVGMLEDRIKEDPRGDMTAWLLLIGEHRKRNKLDDVRSTYDRFFKVFPAAAEQWIAYANMELEINDFYRVEQIFQKSLLQIPSVQLWSTYLNYVRRRNNLTTDPTGNARQIVSQTYDFVLQNVGIDKDAGQIWQDYVQFVRSGPGVIGGNSWQDQQKMDLLRKTFQRAICIPTSAVNSLWKEYDAFEMGLNKMTGRKFLQERSPAYMTARSSNTALQNITRELNRTTLPSLPPALGFEGDLEYMRQVDIWKKWIDWEKDDPLVLKEEDLAAYKARILYVYKQAAMALRFWPELWFDAADFCFNNDLDSDGNDFLAQGTTANPESCLLAFKRADRIETSTSNEEGDESMKRRGDAAREPYDKVLDALYNLISQSKERELQAIARIRESFIAQKPGTPTRLRNGYDEESVDITVDPSEAAQQAQIEAVQKGTAAQTKMLSRTVSFVWIALMRAMRRIQGKGKPNDPIGGSRQIFTDARKRGRLTSDVYVASALIEYHCYKDPAATKIFERGMKLFPEDEYFALEYLKHLIATNDITNARAVFESTVSRLASKPETLARAKPIYSFFHAYEAHYGELSQVSKLEKRMNDLFPEDPQLSLFSQRYSLPGFDPTAIRPIISPSTQARPKAPQSSEKLLPTQESTPPFQLQPASITYSPKRPLEESDSESIPPPRKIARGDSPLKGAAGRRLDAQKRTHQLMHEVNHSSSQSMSYQISTPIPVPPPQPTLPREIMFLLGIIPRAGSYNATIFHAERMVNLLRNTDLTRAAAQSRPQPVQQPQVQAVQYGFPQMNAPYAYGR